MKKILFLFFNLISIFAIAGDDPKDLIRSLNQRFGQVNDYTAHIEMKFDIPGVKMNKMSGKVFFKKPDRFRIRTKGIFFLPKQNPMQNVNSMLLDTNSYTSIISGYEIINGRNCAIVNIIPLKAMNELILGKFWIDVKNPQILRSQITTKNNGTLETENSYSTFSNYNLPDKMVIKLEMKKVKMSKMLAADLNKKATDKTALNKAETGSITLYFSDYKINTKFPDSEFTKEEE